MYESKTVTIEVYAPDMPSQQMVKVGESKVEGGGKGAMVNNGYNGTTVRNEALRSPLPTRLLFRHPPHPYYRF